MQEQSPIREQTSELAQKAKDTAEEVQQRAQGQLRDQVGRRSMQAGEQAHLAGQAFRQTGSQLREQGQEATGRIADQVAERLDAVGSYLTTTDPDRILADAEDFARRNPWGVAAGAAVVGLLASRFLKASSARRREASIVDLRSEVAEPRYEATDRPYGASYERGYEGGYEPRNVSQMPGR